MSGTERGPQVLCTAELIEQYQNLSIPDFQRDYVWSADQWGQLWNDLIELPDDGQHFMGCLTLKEDPETKSYEVLDGQQRLTTLLVLLDFLKWGKSDFSHGNLSLINAKVFPADDTDESKKKEKRLYKEIFEHFAKLCTLSGCPDQKQLTKKLENQFFWLVVGTRAEKHQTFEQLNATGKPLAYSDLLLNYLLELNERKPDGKLEPKEVKEEWAALMRELATGMAFEDDKLPVAESDGEEDEPLSDTDDGEAEDREKSGETGEDTEENEDTEESEGTEESEDAAEAEVELRPLKLKKFLNALHGVALLWPERVPETVESFQKTMSLLCGKDPEALDARMILKELKKWKNLYLALTNPLSPAYRDQPFEMERYYLATLHSTSYLPVTMRVLNRLSENTYSTEDVRAIFGAIVRFSLYSQICIYRSGTGLMNSRKKVVMLDHILDALNQKNLSVQKVLRVIMGNQPWDLKENMLLELPYSSSVSKVVLCIAYEEWRKSEGKESIPAIERQSKHGPFQVEHMVARNLKDGAYGKYGFDVSTVDRPANLILLEKDWNNKLNNKSPEEKKEDWKNSVLYQYYDEHCGTFPKENEGWTSFCKIQEKRLTALWNAFSGYMGEHEPAGKMKTEKVPILWADKRFGSVQRVKSYQQETDKPTQDHVLYSLDDEWRFLSEPKKKADETQACYITFGDQIDRVDETTEELKGKGLELRMIGYLFLFKLNAGLNPRDYAMKTSKNPPPLGPQLYNYVKGLNKEANAKVYAMLAWTAPGAFKEEADRVKNEHWEKGKWEEFYSDPSDSAMGTIWLNSKYSARELAERLRIIYQHFAAMIEPMGFWIETRTPGLQLVGDDLYFTNYVNIGDEEKFLELALNRQQSERQPGRWNANGMKPWFRAEEKSLKDLFGMQLKIPEYQRDYVWDRQNWQDMSGYLEANCSRESIPYGTVILCEEKGTGAYSVVDGQQRLTTLANFYKDIDPCKGLPERCGLSKVDRIQTCFKGDRETILRACLEKIRFTVLFLEGDALPITCPYQVFSAINGKGKKLTAAEKVRNLLCKMLDEKPKSKATDRENVIKYTRNERIPKAWLEMRKREHIPDDRFYSAFKAEIGNKNALESFLRCGEQFETYMVNINSKKKVSGGLKTEMLLYRMLGITTGDALILSWLSGADWESGDAEQAEKKLTERLRKLNVLYFLLYVMDRNGNDKKSINAKLPRLTDGREVVIRYPEENLTLLNESIQSREEDIKTVWDEFVCTYNFGDARKPVARFLLLMIERWLAPDTDQGNQLIRFFLSGQKKPLDDAEVEHIRPISKAVSGLRMNGLENVCLLEKKINTSVSDKNLLPGSKSGKLAVLEKGTNAKKKEKEERVYLESRLLMPGMFYDQGIPRWYRTEENREDGIEVGTYGPKEANARMTEIWNRLQDHFSESIKSVLP